MAAATRAHRLSDVVALGFMKMKLLKSTEPDSNALIPLRAGAQMLGLDSSTIRKRTAGTASLTIVRQGRKLFLVLGEIIAHREKLIHDARLRNDVLRLVRND